MILISELSDIYLYVAILKHCIMMFEIIPISRSVQIKTVAECAVKTQS